ncbi:hypothetical protein AB0E01_33855 [Nocardia vinacea]|uniref:hypothetical protein n=1 Tax=Nocardia vinacea TaxID=96468 RepID=UPI0033E84257
MKPWSLIAGSAPANLAALDAEMIEVPAHHRSSSTLLSMMINVDLARAVQASPSDHRPHPRISDDRPSPAGLQQFSIISITGKGIRRRWRHHRVSHPNTRTNRQLPTSGNAA